jgi:branched-subunit amino acid permease
LQAAAVVVTPVTQPQEVGVPVVLVIQPQDIVLAVILFLSVVVERPVETMEVILLLIQGLEHLLLLEEVEVGVDQEIHLIQEIPVVLEEEDMDSRLQHQVALEHNLH